MPAPRQVEMSTATADDVALEVVHNSEFAPAMSKLAYLTVHNHSTRPQSFVLLGSAPDVTSDNGATAGGFRHGVYQASRVVAANTGSYTFVLPAASPLPWADPLSEPPDVIVVTGRCRKTPTDGTRLFISDYTQLATKDTEDRRCEMTMPETDEPRFKTDKELGAWGRKPRPDMEDGTIDIQVANTFVTHHPDRPFIGIGAPDPYNPHKIIPVCTWDAQPGVLYILKPRMNAWRIAQRHALPGEIVDSLLVPTAREITFDIQRDSEELFFQDANTFAGGSSAMIEELSTKLIQA